MADASYHFLSFVRSGFAASITTPDSFGSGQPALATAPVGVSVSGASQPVTHAAMVRGPGDVIGLAAGQVVRTDPVDGAVGAEPNYFAQVEFDRPDVPWMFTPAASVGEQLRPWIVLVVVDLEGPEACELRSGAPLPKLVVPAAAAGQLPDLAASHLWAHAQVVTPDGQSVAAALDGDPRLSVSRLVCPRHLVARRSYLAAVVPAFEVGRLAGLGIPATPQDEGQLEPAWVAGAAVELPVLHSFRFQTGDEADFELLARRIVGRHLPAEVGARPLDVSRPGAGLPALAPPSSIADTRAVEWLEGALAPLDADAHPARESAAANAFRASLTVLLDRPASLLRAGATDPVVAPPIYGDQHAHVVELGAGSPPPWIAELNLDARTRVAAGLATQVVQERQEDLVARAWNQLGDVLEANRLLRNAQLARGGGQRMHGRLGTLDPATLYAVSAPAHGRVIAAPATGVTVARNVRDSRLPDVAVQAAFRRVTRPGGIVARTAAAPALGATIATRFARDVFSAPVAGPDGATAMRPATQVIGAQASATVLSGLGDAAPGGGERLDAVLTTLGSAARAIPTGDALRTATLRTDIGVVSFATGLGAVQTSAVAALLGASTAAPPQPAGPAQPLGGPSGPGGPLQPLGGPSGPGGSLQPLGGPSGPGGSLQPLGGLGPAQPLRIDAQRPPGGLGPTGPLLAARLRQRLEDADFDILVTQNKVPRIAADADPVTDGGRRLDVFRRDPATLQALADLAEGRAAAFATLDAAAAAAATTGAAAGALQTLASGRFAMVRPVATATVAGAPDLAGARDVVVASAAALDRFATLADAPPPPDSPELALAGAKRALLAQLDPEITVAARLRERIDRGVVTGSSPRDELDPVMACPRFRDPMWEALRDLGADWLLPGLALVPPDTAALVRTNPAFVATYLVALNHELMRELLWREYPTDRRGTGFTRFWGRSGATPDDIGPVHRFAGTLADNLLAGRDGEAVLLLRSELLRRYPGSIVYLSRAKRTGGELMLDDATVVLPAFRGDLPPDVTFVGFPLSPEVLRAPGDPWWFVIAQPPSEPRFGLDEATVQTPAAPRTANELAWSHMSPDGTVARFAIADPPALRGRVIDGVRWGGSAAVQARLTYQRPVRVAIRAADLLPPPVLEAPRP